MARRGKSNGSNGHADGEAPEAPNGGASAERLDKLPDIVRRIESAKSKSDDARSDLGNIYHSAEEDGFNRRALKEAVRLRNMEPDKRRDYLTELNLYCDKIGVWDQGELLDDAPKLPAAPLVESSPYDLGRTAATAGAEASANPFAEGGAERDAWSEGWQEGQRAQPPAGMPVELSDGDKERLARRTAEGNQSAAGYTHEVGRQAGLAGKSSADNPWAEGVMAHGTWHAGWLAGQEELVNSTVGKGRGKRRGPKAKDDVGTEAQVH